MIYSLKGKLLSDGDIIDVLYDPVTYTEEHQFGTRQVILISIEKGYLWGLNLTERPVMMKTLSTDINVFKNTKYGLYDVMQLVDFLYGRRKNIMKSRFRRYKIENILAFKKNPHTAVLNKNNKRVRYSKKAIKNMQEKLEKQEKEGGQEVTKK